MPINSFVGVSRATRGPISRTLAVLMVLVSAAPSVAHSQASASRMSPRTSAADSVRAVRTFVQRFLDWYTPVALADGDGPAYWRVLSTRQTSLTPALASLLRADSVARASSTSSRETLNFDPLLSSQDPCDRYEATEVTAVATGYRVAVRGVCASPGLQTGPAFHVLARNGAWRIANVSLEGTDLVTLLCGYAAADTSTRGRAPLTSGSSRSSAACHVP